MAIPLECCRLKGKRVLQVGLQGDRATLRVRGRKIGNVNSVTKTVPLGGCTGPPDPPRQVIAMWCVCVSHFARTELAERHAAPVGAFYKMARHAMLRGRGEVVVRARGRVRR